MNYLDIQPLANQSFTVNLDESLYDFNITATNGVMSVTISRDNIELVTNIRMCAGTPLLPYTYLMQGNFFLLTENDDYPDYTQFGNTQQLLYLTLAEVEALQTSGIVPRPGYSPSMTLDFIERPTLSSPQGFAATFTRGSVGSYYNSSGLLVSAAINIPRFDYNPTTLDALGLLMEGGATNICLHSETFDDAVWTKLNATISANATTAPDGVASADLIRDNTTNGVHTVAESMAFTSGSAYTFSVFLKAGARTAAKIALPVAAFSGTPYCFINLSNGTLGTPNGCVAYAQALPNGWWRFVITATATATTSGSATIGTAQNLTTDSYVGDGNGVYAWGAQVEVSRYASSYIKTVASTVARSADNAVMATSGWLAGGIGSFYVDAMRAHAGVGAMHALAELSDATANNFLRCYIDATDSNKSKILLTAATVSQFSYSGPTYVSNTEDKMVVAYKANSVIGAINGTLSPLDSAATIPSLTELSIGSVYGGAQMLNGWVRAVQYYPQYLPNTVLVGLTQ